MLQIFGAHACQEIMIDVRSDLLSRPTPAMLAAMAAALQKSPCFDLREDPHVAALERFGAQLLHKEDALFCPTCTMCNELAIHLFCDPGDTLVCEEQSHIVTSEGGAPAALSGVVIRGVRGERGVLSADQVRDAIRPRSGAAPSPVSLLVLENSHARSGGRTMSRRMAADIREISSTHCVRVHLDGARIFNAAVFSGEFPAAFAECADSVSVSLNKGLGAPTGALLAGDREFIARANILRQRWGGGWRSVAAPAAAGLIALEEWSSAVQRDHAHARLFAELLQTESRIEVSNEPVETNLVMIRVRGSPDATERAHVHLKECGILTLLFDDEMRFAFHNGIAEADVGRMTQVLKSFCATSLG